MYAIADLEAFLAIVERGGVSAAAAALDLAPATVSHRLGKLERGLGARLFQRDSRRFRLTEEGERFHQGVGRALDALREAEAAVRGDGSVEGPLRLTAPRWVLRQYVTPSLPRLLERHPRLRIEVLATDRFVNLVEEGLDCALRVGPMGEAAGRVRKIADNARLICAAPDYLARRGAPRSAAELAEHDWILLPWQRHWRLHDGRGGVASVSGRGRLTISDADAMTDAALCGLGMVVKSRLAVAEPLRTGRLVEVLPGALADPAAPIWLLRPDGGRASRRVAAFYEHLRAVFRRVGDQGADPGGDSDGDHDAVRRREGASDRGGLSGP